jgi:hypothetical protein
MVDERESPSAGWREVYDEMEADPDVEEATHRCPDCGQQYENVIRDVYECEEHGAFRASACDGIDDGSQSSEADPDDPPDDSDEVENRARGSAGTA